ncbi:MAG TPA: GntR family transcriptional regulator [Clostridiales bacterium]|nr:GntR family transcriptional regulator [Clostridiales bacterium]
MAAIKKQSLVDQVYERLRADIIHLRMPLGSKVNVNELQEVLGVSCTPIREAINRLQQEGLITYENNVGAHVLTLTAQDVEEIQLLATTLHCAAARLAMERGDRYAMGQQLRALLAKLEQARTPQEQVKVIHHLIEVFYLHCGNRRLDRSMLAIQGQQLLLRNLYAQEGMDMEQIFSDFSQVCQGVEAGDTEQVCAAIRTNAQRMEHCLTCALQPSQRTT